MEKICICGEKCATGDVDAPKQRPCLPVFTMSKFSMCISQRIAFPKRNIHAPHTRWCYFSAQFASTYSAIARAYPGIPTLALDYGKEHATLNPWIAIAGLPSVLLFKGVWVETFGGSREVFRAALLAQQSW